MSPLRIAITGADGFLGWHLRAFLHADADVTVIPIGRSVFENSSALAERLVGADTVVHLAGMNRGDAADIRRVNAELAGTLTAGCDRAGVAPQILYANSTHQGRSGAYGESKRAAAEHLASWCSRSNAPFANLVLPHLFGEHGRPFYNSGVATFCHQLANGETPVIATDGEVELLHAQSAAREVLRIARTRAGGELRSHGRRMRISAALTRITDLLTQYRDAVIPAFVDELDLDLFNTLRSYLYPKHYPVRPLRRSDTRGTLFEAVKTLHGGQCFMSTTRPGATRGNHYHRRKMERFLVVHGQATVRVRRLLGTHVEEFKLNGEIPGYIDMPTLHTHNIVNTGSSDLITLFWTHEIFDPSQPDTYPEPV